MSIGIYFAGKIGHTDWRHALVERATGQWRILRDSDGPFDFTMGSHRLTYQGPFFLSCDHGCYHGERTHGRGLGIRAGCPAGDYPNPPDQTRLAVQRRAIEAIHRADCVFAFIHSPTCFGTLFELGYAHAIRKPTAICFATRRLARDMWFSSQGARTVVRIGADPHDQLNTVLMRGFPFALDNLRGDPQ